jgi:hypothetical protein
VSRVSELARRVPAEAACFGLVASVYVAYFLTFGDGRFYYDSADYWRLGERFEKAGDFSFLSYHDPYRGYSLPLFNHTLQLIASALGLGDVTIVELAGALLAATLGVVILPRLARELFPGADIGWLRVLALNALVFVFWRDHFNFPLTDFPALLLASIGLLGLLQRTAAGYLLAGLGFGLAANMRPAYVPALAVAVAIAALSPLRREWGRRARNVAVVIVGSLAVSLPQIAIDHHQSGSWSLTRPGAKDISLVQLSGGLIAQRYETFVGSRDQYPRAKLFYVDPFASNVLEEEEIAGVSSYGQYASVVLHHPHEMAASYALHLFNGLDLWYPTPYIRDLDDRRVALSVFQYTLLFLTIARLLLPEARRRLGRIRWAGVVVLLSPCLAAIPGAVEPRFFLPLYALAYMLVCFGPETRALFHAGSQTRRVALASSYVAFVIVCLTLSAATRAQIEHPASVLSTLRSPKDQGSRP